MSRNIAGPFLYHNLHWYRLVTNQNLAFRQCSQSKQTNKTKKKTLEIPLAGEEQTRQECCWDLVLALKA